MQFEKIRDSLVKLKLGYVFAFGVTDVTFSRIYKTKQMLVEFLKECDMNSDRKL